ncbi:MAG TPA: hypothetical protein VFI62_03515 [Burkholderiales bacterium]|nr:hypothetical protein [Burkholderiales bacterium]
MVHIKAIHAETRGGYGWPRTRWELRARAIRMGVGKDRAQKLMQPLGFGAKGKRASKSPPTLATNCRSRLTCSTRVHRKRARMGLVGDITDIATDEVWLFLAVVIDPLTR